MDWNTLLSQLTAAGTTLGSEALATPGTTILPNGTVVLGTPYGTSAIQQPGIDPNSLLMIGLVIGAVVLVSSMNRGKH